METTLLHFDVPVPLLQRTLRAAGANLDLETNAALVAA